MGQEATGANIPENGENYKLPLPGPTPEIGEKLPKKYNSCIFGVIFPLFGNFGQPQPSRVF